MLSKLSGLIKPVLEFITTFFSPEAKTTRTLQKLRKEKNKALANLAKAISSGDDDKVRYYSSIVKRLNEEISNLREDRRYL